MSQNLIATAALMPRWWQLTVLLILRVVQLSLLAPFLLLFLGKISLVQAILCFFALVVLQYAVLFAVNKIEMEVSKSKVEQMSSNLGSRSSDLGENE
jgi:hypothetical protein